MGIDTNEGYLGHDEVKTFSKTAFIYAYRIKSPYSPYSPNEITLAYQVNQPLAPHQCDWGKNLTALMLKDFKEQGGSIKVINSNEELIMPLSEYKVLVPVPPKLLQEWGLSNLLD